MCTNCPRTSVQHAGSVLLFRQELTLQSATSLSLTDFHPARKKALRRARLALKEVHSHGASTQGASTLTRREHSSRRKHPSPPLAATSPIVRQLTSILVALPCWQDKRTFGQPRLDRGGYRALQRELTLCGRVLAP